MVTEPVWQGRCGESAHCVEVSHDTETDEVLVRSSRNPDQHIRLDMDEWYQLRFNGQFRLFPGGDSDDLYPRTDPGDAEPCGERC